ncbi:MAG: SUF system NifU family Fe-S cluster assembly protein [Dehalococcoidia bacterium]|nr:SUF system NifU family Fe-S cluster assembly protein [Dehalococcoidia bacterium]
MQKFPFDQIDDLYRDVIIRHHRASRSQPEVGDPDVEYDEYNPICGDRVVLQLRVVEGRIVEAGFKGEGCSITQASASMMTDALEGLTLEEAEDLADRFRLSLTGDGPPGSPTSGLGDLEALQAVRAFPVRIKCALLGWSALEQGIEEYRARPAA